MEKTVIKVALIFIFLLNACAGLPVEKKQQVKITVSNESVYKDKEFWPDIKLANAFADYWTARMERDAEYAFRMEAPHFQEMINLNRYKVYADNYRNDVAEIQMQNREYESERLLNLTFSFVVPGLKNTIEVREKWLHLNGKWYHLLRDFMFFQELESF